MSAAEILRAAKTLIEDEAAWMQCDFAQNDQGVPVASQAPDACKWCAVGALKRIVDDYDPAYIDALALLADHDGPVSSDDEDELIDRVATTNDYSDHAGVLEMYDQAIERANPS